MQKYITRTMNVKEITYPEADFVNRSFTDVHKTLIDETEIPENATVDYETVVKVRMPIEQFYELGEKVEVAEQQKM